MATMRRGGRTGEVIIKLLGTEPSKANLVGFARPQI